MVPSGLKMGILSRATRNIARRKTRAILVIAALSLALTMLIVLPPSIRVREDITQTGINLLLEDAQITASAVTLSATEIQCGYPFILDLNTMLPDAGGTIWFTQTFMNQSILEHIKAIPDVTNVIPILELWETANRSYRIYGVPLENDSYRMDPTILPQNITQGRNLQVGDSGVVVLEDYIAENMSASVGDTITLLGRNFTVVGIEGRAEYNKGVHEVSMSIVDAQTITNKTGQAYVYYVFVNDIDNVNTVMSRIRSLDSRLDVYGGLTQMNAVKPVQDQLEALTQSSQSNLNQIRTTGLIEVGIAVVADTAIILFIMLYSVRERTKEIGTLKAMGAGNGTILGQFMFEGILLSLIAVAIAIAIGIFVLPTLASVLLPMPVQTGPSIWAAPNGTVFLTPGGTSWRIDNFGVESNSIPADLTGTNILVGVAVAVLLGALGSLYPALKAARTKPAEAMRYE